MQNPPSPRALFIAQLTIMEAVKESPQATDHQPLKKCSSNASLSGSASGCFDCNICLDFAAEPVVTLCGHLYCWPCIYKWLNQSDDNSCDSLQQCPVCKAALSQSDLVPLYGRGHSAKPSHQGLQDIPLRPPSAHRVVRRPESTREARFDHYNLHHRQQHFNMDRYSDHVSPPASPRRSLHFTPPPASPRRLLRFTSGGSLGGMAVAVFPWVFRDREASMQDLSPYDSVGGLSLPRIRRQEMEVERSLHQIWVFFCCCTILCLLLF